jgi:ribosome-binding ATPase YchF (GTP1/OBG family)
MFSYAAALTKKSLRPQARLISSSKSFGLVGLPNSGKSTVFNALVRKSLATVGNFPFCTIDPTSTLVPVVDHRLETLARLEIQRNSCRR